MFASEVVAGVPSMISEFRTIGLGDKRLNERVLRVVSRLSAAPGMSFPQALKTEAELEGFYRVVGNERVSYDALMQPHLEQTLQRLAGQTTVRAVHDTTECAFAGEGERLGLGPLGAGRQAKGFFAHVTLAVTADDSKLPLGVLGSRCWARPAQPRKRGKTKMSGGQYARFKDKESARWQQQIEQVEQAVGDTASLVHIMDREADAYALLADLVANGRRFVVRMAHDRVACELEPDGEPLEDERMHLSELLVGRAVQLVRQVPLSRRRAHPAPHGQRSHPERPMRSATLGVYAQRLALQRPRYATDLPDTLEVHIVYVRELGTPADEVPVTWVLVTSEPIDTTSQIEAVLDHYRARWLIEEFFKALKTGCALEKRQLESFRALTNALALLLPIAWQMLLLRALTRLHPDAPADQALNRRQIALLRRYQPQKMTDGATVQDALYAVAGLGGHLKKNGPPGWQTLARGMETLIQLEMGWIAANANA